MTARLVVVRECYECPNAKDYGAMWHGFCGPRNRPLPPSALPQPCRAGRIPAWCPLPKAPKRKRGAR